MTRKLSVPLAVWFCAASALVSCATTATTAAAKAPRPAASFEKGSAWLAAAELPTGRLEGLSLEGGRLVLAPGSASGSWESPVLEAPLFNWLVPSWDASVPDGSGVSLSFQVWSDGAWSSWYSFGQWSDRPASARSSDGAGRVDVDTLILSRDVTLFRARAELRSGSGASPSLAHLGWATRNFLSGRPTDGEAIAALPELERDVPRRSQMVESPAIASRICSPTSVSMALAYFGTDKPTAEVADGCYDVAEGIYGNWAFNAAYLCSQGLEARVDYFYSLADVARELEAGNIVIASVKFGSGELPGAPIDSTAGHLMLVRGFARRDGQVYVVVNDPAAPDAGSVRREYLADRFFGAWIGVVYVVGPRR